MLKESLETEVQNKFKFEDVEYGADDLSEDNIKRFLKLQFIQGKLQELQDNAALLHKAKNGYIADLKDEIISGKLGVDIVDLISEWWMWFEKCQNLL